MSREIVKYAVKMVYDDDAIRLLFKTEYDTYEGLRKLLRYLLAVVLLFSAFFAQFPIAVKGVMMLAGCWFLVTPDFPSKVQAEGVLSKRKGGISTVTVSFLEKEIQLENRARIPYRSLDRLIEDDVYYYLFVNRQTAVMIPRKELQDQEKQFRAFIEKKTEKTWKKNFSFISMNLKDLVQMVRDQKNK